MKHTINDTINKLILLYVFKLKINTNYKQQLIKLFDILKYNSIITNLYVYQLINLIMKINIIIVLQISKLMNKKIF